MKSTTKVLLVTSAVGFFVTSAHSVLADKSLSAKISETPINQSVNEHASTSELLLADPLVTNYLSMKNPEANPLASVGTGWSNKFKSLTQMQGTDLRLQTESNSLIALGMGVSYQTGIVLDSEIAAEFFSTPNWERYVSGSIDRFSTTLPVNKTVSIKDLLGVSKGERIVYERESNSLVYYSPSYLFSTSQYVKINIGFELSRWYADYGKLVERKPYYKFSVTTQATDTWFNPSWGAAETTLAPDFENSWIENKVEPSTIVTDDDKEFHGVAKQDGKNEHPSTYTGELYLNGNLVKNNIPIDKDGKWSTNIGTLAYDGSEISFRVVAKEKETNGNGIINTRFSEFTYYTVGNSVPNSQWVVKDPTIQTLFDGETAIFGTLPRQNKQNKRTYDLIITLNGKEISKKEIDGTSGEYAIPLIDTILAKGDKVTAQIVGHEPLAFDKKSKVISTIVEENQDGQESWENWKINNPTLQVPKVGDISISGNMPSQNKFNARTYEMVATLNGKEVGRSTISPLGGDFAFTLGKKEELTALKVDDKIEVQVIGHEKDKDDKTSDKVAEVVKDDTGYNEWKVNTPKIQEVIEDGATTITVENPEQNSLHGRNYDMNLYVDGELVSTQTSPSKETINFTLENAVHEDQVVTAKVHGHQNGRDDKVSEQDSVTVAPKDTHAEWEVNKASIAEVTVGDKSITVTSPEQDTTKGRTYEVELTVNGENLHTKSIKSDETIQIDTADVDFVAGDTVAATIVGHEADHEDKRSEIVETIVIGAWAVNMPTIAEVTVGDETVTVTSPEQDTTKGRTYEVELAVNGENLHTQAINSEETNQIDVTDIDFVAGDTVTATIVGHETGQADLRSDTAETIVIAKTSPTTTRFAQGYWQSFGLVYEGEVDNAAWSLDTIDSIRKVVRIIDENETTQSSIDAFNTNWYTSDRYTGYQFILSNTMLGQLSEGHFTLVMDIYIDGELTETTQLNPTNAMRSGAFHDKYNELEQTVINYNFVNPTILNNQPGLVITKNSESAKLKLVNKYWSDNDAYGLVFDGYIPADIRIPSTGHHKNLIVTDSSGTVVFTKDLLDAVETNWETGIDVPLENVFQAVIPREFSDEYTYTYTVKVTNAEGTLLIEDTLNSK